MAAGQQGFPNISAPFVTIKDGIIEKSWLRFLITLWLRSGSAQGGAVFASGDIKYSGSANVQDGWLICDGSPVSRIDFNNLFASIGVTWGSGDGTTTFNIPNLQGKVLVGSGLQPVGTSGGSATQTLTTANLAAHNHPITDPTHSHTFTGTPHNHTITDPGHAHTAAVVSSGTADTGTTAAQAASGSTGTATTGITVNNTTAGGTISSSSTGITVGNNGSGTPFSIMQPYAVGTALIKI